MAAYAVVGRQVRATRIARELQILVSGHGFGVRPKPRSQIVSNADSRCNRGGRRSGGSRSCCATATRAHTPATAWQGVDGGDLSQQHEQSVRHHQPGHDAGRNFAQSAWRGHYWWRIGCRVRRFAGWRDRRVRSAGGDADESVRKAGIEAIQSKLDF